MSRLGTVISVSGREPMAAPSGGDLARLRHELDHALARMCPRWMADEREDLLQSALIRVMRLANKRRAPDPVPARYIRKVAYTQVVDEIRRRRRRRESSLERLEEGGAEFSSPISDPERDTSSRELSLAIQDCIQKLIPSRRRAITLALLGRKNREIAELMGWKPKRAENLVTRGRAELRRCLEGKGQGL